MTTRIDLDVPAGATYAHEFLVTGPDGGPLAVPDYTASFEVRVHPGDPTPAFAASDGHFTLAAGRLILTLPPEVTDALPARGTHALELHAPGRVYRLAFGAVLLRRVRPAAA